MTWSEIVWMTHVYKIFNIILMNTKTNMISKKKHIPIFEIATHKKTWTTLSLYVAGSLSVDK